MEAIAMILDATAAELDPACWQLSTTGRYGADPAGAQLQRLRHAAGLSLHEVAETLGITPDAVSRWEAGHGSPSPRHRAPLARLYRVAEVPLPARVRARETEPQAGGPLPIVGCAPPRLDGARLRAARQAHGWTQADLAERVGVSAAAISRRESHSRAPHWAMWERVTGALGMSVEDLVLVSDRLSYGEGSPPTPRWE
jgi:transcriptional regulator with XRE-family HTH domain